MLVSLQQCRGESLATRDIPMENIRVCTCVQTQHGGKEVWREQREEDGIFRVRVRSQSKWDRYRVGWRGRSFILVVSKIRRYRKKILEFLFKYTFISKE